MRKSVKSHRRPALVDRLRRWWHKRAIAHLDAITKGQHARITAAELESELVELADALPATRNAIDAFRRKPAKAERRDRMRPEHIARRLGGGPQRFGAWSRVRDPAVTWSQASLTLSAK